LTQRARVVTYLVCLHLIFAAGGVALFLRDPLWLFAVEALFAVSLATGIILVRGILRNLAFARAGGQLMRDNDFTSRLLPVGEPEIDELVTVYNRMVDSLREERIRLQEQHHFLGHILRVSPSGIVILDFDRRIATVNPAGTRLLGLADAALTGRRLDELGSALAQALAALPRHRTEVVSASASRRVRCHHGTFIDRGFARSFLLIEELTEELRHAERGAYEKLVRVMAHEVNNSVTASNSLLHSSLTYGTELSSASRPDFEQAIGIVIERTNQLNLFMRSFADVFRLPPPVKAPERVLPMLDSNVRLLSARADGAGVSWHWDVDDRDLVVPLDRGQMEQAFLNVLQNAVDATGGQGTITIRLRTPDGARPAAMIEDSGPGIADEAQANLFTPFFSTKPHGQGIGLTLVQEILSGHGFDYALERLPGGPTRFTITF
jgi:two-component system, NtrC family, nitrogen regulation sensor histidine kinase NtrY